MKARAWMKCFFLGGGGMAVCSRDITKIHSIFCQRLVNICFDTLELLLAFAAINGIANLNSGRIIFWNYIFVKKSPF